jgi:phosphoribosyl-ATP pyrophosphohydrolase/phosphoribosyl-AMP cyclohydrolase
MKYSGSEEALEECLEEKNLDFSKYCNSIEVKDKNNSNAPDFFEELYKTVHERILLKTANSYTYKLHLDGLDKIIKKFGEESIEVILAAKHQDRKNLIYEIADLFYHLTVLMVEKDISYNEIISELESRKK